MDPSRLVLIIRILLAAALIAFLIFLMINLTRSDPKQAVEITIPPAHFFLAEGPEMGTVIPLLESNLIGRSSNCTIQLDEPTVSAAHARLSFSNQQWLLEDLGSRNGTLVNDIPVDQPVSLVFGDHIHFGKVMVVLTARIDPPTEPDERDPELIKQA